MNEAQSYTLEIVIHPDGRPELKWDIQAEATLSNDQKWVAAALQSGFDSVHRAWLMGEEAKRAPRLDAATRRKHEVWEQDAVLTATRLRQAERIEGAETFGYGRSITKHL